MLTGKSISLRALEPTDLDLLYKWENNPEVWTVSNTLTPFSKFILEQYIANSHLDIYSTKQLRLLICLLEQPIGNVDLFDFDPFHHRAGIGILIAEGAQRFKGYASEALSLLINYGFNTLGLNQLYCNVGIDNEASLALFKKHGFEITGTKKQWVKNGNNYQDEYLLQLIRK